MPVNRPNIVCLSDNTVPETGVNLLLRVELPGTSSYSQVLVLVGRLKVAVVDTGVTFLPDLQVSERLVDLALDGFSLDPDPRQVTEG